MNDLFNKNKGKVMRTCSIAYYTEGGYINYFTNKDTPEEKVQLIEKVGQMLDKSPYRDSSTNMNWLNPKETFKGLLTDEEISRMEEITHHAPGQKVLDISNIQVWVDGQHQKGYGKPLELKECWNTTKKIKAQKITDSALDEIKQAALNYMDFAEGWSSKEKTREGNEKIIVQAVMNAISPNFYEVLNSLD